MENEEEHHPDGADVHPVLLALMLAAMGLPVAATVYLVLAVL